MLEEKSPFSFHHQMSFVKQLSLLSYLFLPHKLNAKEIHSFEDENRFHSRENFIKRIINSFGMFLNIVLTFDLNQSKGNLT